MTVIQLYRKGIVGLVALGKNFFDGFLKGNKINLESEHIFNWN